MVEKEEFEGQESFRCEECGFHYEERRKVEECEEHCRDYDACDTRIAENSLERSV
jgi:hypothetical protein